MIAVGTGIGLSTARPIAPQIDALETSGEAASSTSVQRTADGVPYVVDPSALVDAGLSRDGVSPIDAPSFESIESADEWIEDDALILVIEHAGVTRAYPIQILVWHEIVNDTIAGDPLLITYCPLCASSAAYVRTVDGRILTFGTSGRLLNSNLVMYDRETGSYWSQLNGLSIVGDLAGQSLVRVAADLVRWGDWKTLHPDAAVLSRETGFDRDYTQNPYAEYLQDNTVCFPLSDRDNRIPVKTPVLGVELEESFVAVVEEALMARGSIELRVDGERIVFSCTQSGAVRVSNLDTGASLVAVRTFWFAWYAFYPETQLSDGSPL
jgi:hypothetical protein